MFRNYIIGQHESLDIDVDNVGSDQFAVRADGLTPSAFSTMQIFSDSARLIPLAGADWEYYTEDPIKTASEATVDGSGLKVYSQIKVKNPSFQAVPLYLTFENFGSYPDGDVQTVDYIEIDANYAYTTQRNLMTYLVVSGLSADITITVTDGGFDQRSRFKVVNLDATYKVIVDDDVSYNVYPLGSADFYDISGALKWVSAGWETVWYEPANVDTNPVLTNALISGLYRVKIYGSSTSRTTLFEVDLTNSSNDARGTWDAAVNFTYTYATKIANSALASYYPRKIDLWHDAA